MMHHSAPENVIVEQVRALLDMDEGKKRAQLVNAMKNKACNNQPNAFANATKNNAMKNKACNAQQPSSYPHAMKNNAMKINQVNGSTGRKGLPSSYAGSISTYVGSSNGHQPTCSGWGGSASGGSASGGSGHGSGASGSGCEPSYYPDSPETSGSEGFAKAASDMPDVPPPPGLAMQWQQDEPAFAPDPSLATTQGGVACASSQLEHATDLLKAALANWEACLNGEEARQGEKPPKKGPKAQQVKTPEQPQSMPVKIPVDSLMLGSPTQAKSPPAQKAKSLPQKSPASASAGDGSALAMQALQKALSDLTGSLPGEIDQAPTRSQEDPNIEVVKLLSSHLKKQQEESVQKIMSMVQQQQMMTPEPALDPMSSCWPGAGGCDGSWMQMGEMGVDQNAPFAAAAEGPFGYPSADAWPAANTYGPSYGMHAMGMMPGMPWPNQPMPGNAGNAGMAAARNGWMYEHQANFRQGGNHHNGMGPPGLHTPPARKNRSAAAPPAGTEEETLRKHLKELQKIDPDRVILVRKINRLGFQSPASLQAHYSKYGAVEKVLVAHSHVKSQNCRFAARLRPSGLGFVVMSKKEDASTILALGPEQVVRGGLDGTDVNIRVQRFQHCSDDTEESNDKDDRED